MVFYVLTKVDWEFGRVYAELYENELDAKNEMWNKAHWQNRIREGLSINMLNDRHIVLEKRNGEEVQRIVEFTIEEKEVY